MAKKQKEEEINEETKKVLSDGEKIRDLMNNDGWKIAKEKLFSKLITLDSITSVDDIHLNDLQRIREYEVRKGVVSIILEWIRDVEGDAERHVSNVEAFKKVREDSIVKYFD